MQREFDREIYLNKEKYNAAIEEENKRKEELISIRIEDMRKESEYYERQWRYLRKCIMMDIRSEIAKNNGASDEGIELMNGLAEEFFTKFLVSAGVKNPPGVTEKSKAITWLKGEGLI